MSKASAPRKAAPAGDPFYAAKDEVGSKQSTEKSIHRSECCCCCYCCCCYEVLHDCDALIAHLVAGLRCRFAQVAAKVTHVQTSHARYNALIEETTASNSRKILDLNAT
jgi:hypothetical protein